MNYLPLELMGGCNEASDTADMLLACCNICCRSGCIAGAGREAVLVDKIFPLEITYTEQKSGTPFKTLAGMSFALNLLCIKTAKIRTFFFFMSASNRT